jgi:hypothetical protein
MFDGFAKSSALSKATTVFVVMILSGLGLCGGGAVAASHLGGLSPAIFAVGGIFFWAGLLGMIVVAIVAVISGIVRAIRGRQD